MKTEIAMYLQKLRFTVSDTGIIWNEAGERYTIWNIPPYDNLKIIIINSSYYGFFVFKVDDLVDAAFNNKDLKQYRGITKNLYRPCGGSTDLVPYTSLEFANGVSGRRRYSTYFPFSR